MRLVLGVLFILATSMTFAKDARLAPKATRAKAQKSAKPKHPARKNSKALARAPKDNSAQPQQPPQPFKLEAPVAIRATTAQLDPAVAIAPSYSTEEEKLKAVLSFVYYNDAHKYGWPSNYTAMWCPTNAFHLLKRLQQAGVDLTDAEVWYVVPSESATGAGDSIIYPRQARPIGGTTIDEWSFHVVISVKGRILDLDFKSQPEVVLQVEYAAQMWQKGPLARPREDTRALYVRRIPATDYLTQYTDNWDYYISGGNGRYPAVEMSSLFPRAGGNALQ